jgi:transposase
MSMSAIATPVNPTDEEREELERWLRLPTTEQRSAFRARVVLAAAAGEGSASIARREAVRLNTVSTWRSRFADSGIAGLRDQQRAGRPRQYGAEAEQRLLAQLDEPPPEGYGSWNGTLLGQALAIPADQVWRILRRNGIQLQRRRSWCISTDPEFAPKAAEIVGLYLDPPENAVVLCLDEKPSIQALERAQGYLRLANGKAVRGQSHEYKRHGTTTLFAALEVGTGKVNGMHARRKRRQEFLAFMNQIDAAYPGQELHVVLDNFVTHKPKHDAWLARHPNVHFHFTPTHASWLNQVEVWFSILARSALLGSSFTSSQEVCELIDRFIQTYNRQARPFRWTAKEVRPSAPQRKIADLSK